MERVTPFMRCLSPGGGLLPLHTCIVQAVFFLACADLAFRSSGIHDDTLLPFIWGVEVICVVYIIGW